MHITKCIFQNRLTSNIRQRWFAHKRLDPLRLTPQSSQPSSCNRLPNLTSSPEAARKWDPHQQESASRVWRLWVMPSFLDTCRLQSWSIPTLALRQHPHWNDSCWINRFQLMVQCLLVSSSHVARLFLSCPFGPSLLVWSFLVQQSFE